MNWNELKKKAVENGWIFERHGKKHDIYYHPEEVKKGLYHDLKKKIGF